MPPSVVAPGVLPSVPDVSWSGPALKALGRRPDLGEGTDIILPPAAEQRAQTVFEAAGIILVVLIALAGAWVLTRRRI